MAVIEVVKWDAEPGVFAWKFPSQELSTWTQLIVSETQEAFLVKEGQFMGPFTAGRHTLNTDNYPVLSSFVNIVSKKSPFTAEVWFIQKAFKLNEKWGTAAPLQMEDPKYKVMLPVRAYGQYGIQISNSYYFLAKLVGTLPAFVHSTIADFMRGIVSTIVKDTIAKYLIEKSITVLHISAHLQDISSHIEAEVAETMRDYGISIVNFSVSSITTDDNDPTVKHLKETLSKKLDMDILGYNYHQMRSFDVMHTAAGNEGVGGAVMGAGMGMGMGLGMGVPMGQATSNMATNLQFTPTVECQSCHAQISSGSRFCPQCGTPRDQQSKCPGCGGAVVGNSKFCPHCGSPLGKRCSSCGASVIGNGSFCPECGQKL